MNSCSVAAMKVDTMQIVTCQGCRRLRRVIRQSVPTPFPQPALATWENELARRLALARSVLTGIVRKYGLPATERARTRRLGRPSRRIVRTLARRFQR